MPTRAEFLKMLLAVGLMPRASAAEPTQRAALELVCKGLQQLNDEFWSAEMAIWLDRPGKDLRGVFGGRINPPWWSCANVVELMVDYMNTAGTSQFDAQLRALHEGNVLRGSRLPVLAETLRKRGIWKHEDERTLASRMRSLDATKVLGSQFRNEYLDDSAWWGIAWLSFYERNQDRRYLDTAIAIQQHMSAYERKDGGISWAIDDDKRGANAITNSLYVILSARLFRFTKNDKFKQDAEKIFTWEKREKLYDGVAVVDRPGHRGDYWTYNQGAWLGALVELHAATGDDALLDDTAAALGTMLDGAGLVTKQDILWEKLSADGWDVGLFKGIFARYLRLTARALRSHKDHHEVVARCESVLLASAKAIASLARDQQLYPLEWHQPVRAEINNYNTQASALICLLAAAKP